MELFGQILNKNAFAPQILLTLAEFVSDVKDFNFSIQQFKDANKFVIQDTFMI